MIQMKMQYDINREAANISVLSSGKIDKYEYLIVEEIFPFNLSKIIEHANLLILGWEKYLKNK